ncbi:MAG: aminoglycoside phosphotransferase family protein [Chloroflexaceae bacterium]|nr:aminoglycoside phosphotransferase family protein [Chloroflexaceae bacterium]
MPNSELDLPAFETIAGLAFNTGALQRIAGGYETEVYLTADSRYVIKLKHDGGSREAMLAWARRMRAASELFARYLGPRHSLPNAYLVVDNGDTPPHVLSVQPFLPNAQNLDSLDYDTLSPDLRQSVFQQLITIVERSTACYQATGYTPDLYGVAGMHAHERHQRSSPRWLFQQAWRMLMQQPLLNAHNLMLTSDGRVVLVDYDLICHCWLNCRVYYAARRVLLWRDRAQLQAMNAER